MGKNFRKTKVVEWCALRDLNVELQRIFGRFFNAILQMNGRLLVFFDIPVVIQTALVSHYLKQAWAICLGFEVVDL